MAPHRCIIALALVGCAKNKPPAATPVDPGATPVLPAPEGSHYALGVDVPTDPLVGDVVRTGLFIWVESLSGAATRLVLDTERAPTLDAARWAAVRAGYPHPITEIIEGTEPAGVVPTELIDVLRARLRQGDHLGLVRARTAAGDKWLALIGRPAVTVAEFAREHPVGTTLELDADALGGWVAVSPQGSVQHGALPLAVQLDTAGEWWVELRASDTRPLLALPVYAGTPTPVAPLLHDFPDDLPDPTALPDLVLDALDEIRSTFELPALDWDPTLATLATTPVRQVRAGTWDHTAGVQRLRGAGFLGGPLEQVTCTAPSVPACIHNLMRHADDRAALLNPGMRLVGVAGEVRTDGVTLVANLSSE